MKQRTKINRDIGKKRYNIEKNTRRKMNNINNEIKTIERVFRKRKEPNKNYEDLYSRISEVKSSKIRLKNDITVSKCRKK